jgi:CRP/FNR family transcriptional regulator
MLTRQEALRSVPMFRPAPPELIDRVLESCVEQVHLKGDVLFMQGDPPKGLFVVWRGALKVFKLGEEGREQILEIEGPGRSVAELPLFDGLPYPACCAAIEDSVVLFVPVDAFHRLLEGEPSLPRAVIATLSQRLRRMVALVEELSLKAVRQRLADLILELSDGRDSFDLPWNNQELASRIGTVREIVSRAMGRMIQEGAIRLEGRTLVILDRRRL